jgi:hypothetical protein
MGFSLWRMYSSDMAAPKLAQVEVGNANWGGTPSWAKLIERVMPSVTNAARPAPDPGTVDAAGCSCA